MGKALALVLLLAACGSSDLSTSQRGDAGSAGAGGAASMVTWYCIQGTSGLHDTLVCAATDPVSECPKLTISKCTTNPGRPGWSLINMPCTEKCWTGRP